MLMRAMVTDAATGCTEYRFESDKREEVDEAVAEVRRLNADQHVQFSRVAPAIFPTTRWVAQGVVTGSVEAP